MTTDIFEIVRDSARRMGASDPTWLKEGEAPEFTVTAAGDSGPQMVLLHGLFGAMSNWDTTLPLFAKFCRTQALEFPILTGNRSEVRVKALTSFTEYFLRSRKMGPTILCGNSLGGHVALRIALANPELVDCLVLSGTSGLYERTVDSLPVRPGRKFVEEHMARVFVNKEFITEEAIEEITTILASRKNTLNLIHAARSAKKDNLLEYLKEIKIPTLLLWGEDDVVTSMDVAESFHKNIAGSKLVSIKECGHAPMIEHPQWFADQVEAFVKEHSKYNKAS